MSATFTKQAIVSTFMKLLNERPLDKITVKDIVQACGINRNTFYYHYRDIYSLLQDIFETETRRIIEEHRPTLAWKDGVLQYARLVLENKQAFYHVFHSVKREALETYLLDIADVIVEDYVLSVSEGLTVSNEDVRYVILFYKHAFAGVIYEWLRDGMRADIEHAVSRLSELFDGSIRRTLERASK